MVQPSEVGSAGGVTGAAEPLRPQESVPPTAPMRKLMTSSMLVQLWVNVPMVDCGVPPGQGMMLCIVALQPLALQLQVLAQPPPVASD